MFQRLRQLVEDCFCEEWFALHGSLLPTNNGHNSPLTRAELAVLNHFIRSSVQGGPVNEPLAKEEGIKEREGR